MSKSENNVDVFINELLSGKSQRQSYYIAFPKSRKWKPETVDSKASIFLKTEKVKSRYEELLGKKTDESIITREEILKSLVKGLRMALGEQEMEVSIEQKGITQSKKIKSPDLKAIRSITETILKMQGWNKEKPDTVILPVQIVDDV